MQCEIAGLSGGSPESLPARQAAAALQAPPGTGGCGAQARAGSGSPNNIAGFVPIQYGGNSS